MPARPDHGKICNDNGFGEWMMDVEDMVTKNCDFLVTRSNVDRKISVQSLLNLLRLRKTSGVIQIALHKGGVRGITLVEETPASAPQSGEIRKVMGME